MDAIAQIQTAIRHLADRCNHAQTLDGAGFSRYDADWGHMLANRPFWTNHMVVKAWELAKKYEGQLQQGGVMLPANPPTAEDMPPVPTIPEPPKKNLKKIAAIDGGFSVSFPYDATLVQSIKAIACSKRFDGQRKSWIFPPKSLLKLEKWGKQNGFDISALEPLLSEQHTKAQSQLNFTHKVLQALPNLDAPLPNGKILMEHQKEAIPLMVREGRFILGDDMGLGKTLTALIAVQAYHKASNDPILIVAPKSTHSAWIAEAASLNLPVEVFSWGKLPLPLESTPYLLIVDECHRSQAGGKSQRGQAFLDLSLHPNCKVLFALSGTPMRQMRPKNFFPLLQAVKHPLAEDKKHYERYFCLAHATRFTKWDTTGSAHLDELFTLASDKFLRRTKTQCLSLPPFTRIFREVEVSPAAQKVYDARFQELRKSYQERLARKEIKSGGDVLVLLSHLNHAASIAKCEGAVEFANDLLDAGKQVVLFTLYEETAQALHAALGGELLTGATSQAEREAGQGRFNAGESRVFVSNLKAGGEGINLQERCSECIILDRPWVYDDISQAESRLNRNGQKEPIFSTWLRAFTLDEKRDAFLLQQSETAKLMEAGQAVKIPTLNEIAEEIAREIFQ